MNKRTALIQEINKVLDFDITEKTNIGIADLSIHLENKGLINFTIEFRENQNDECWLQAEYWCNGLGVAIIIDYGVDDRYENIEDFADNLLFISEQIKKIEERIN